MKIAVACEGKAVTQHFGYCEKFTVFNIDNNEIVKVEDINNPGHKPGFLPNYLHEFGIDVIISGGMGASAIELFNNNGIKVITGASGNAEAVVKDYLGGRLFSTNSPCLEHKHHDEC